MVGHSRFWNYLLDASLGYREERPCFHSNVHSISSCYNSRHFCVLVERKPLLGKVIKVIITYTYQKKYIYNYILFSSIYIYI
jgi:hypothetical protein